MVGRPPTASAAARQPAPVAAVSADARRLLQRVLAHERALGWTDRAVVGGLAALLPAWAARATGALPPEVAASVVAALDGYGALDPAARPAAVERALALLGPLERDEPRSRPQATARESAEPVRTARPERRPAPALADAAADEPAPSPTRRAGWAEPGADAPQADGPGLGAALAGLKGIGERTEALLGRLGLSTAGDLLWHLPQRYEDFTRASNADAIADGDDVAVEGIVTEVSAPGGRGRQPLRVVLRDDTGAVECRFFNQPWLAGRISRGQRIRAFGRATLWQGRPVLTSPEWEAVRPGSTAAPMVSAGRLLPVYPLTGGLAQKTVRRIMARHVPTLAALVGDPLPRALRAAEGLPLRAEALLAVHLPVDGEDARLGRERLAFDQVLLLQLWARRRRIARAAQAAPDLAQGAGAEARYLAGLPFTPTSAQTRAIAEIAADAATTSPMRRLLLGDVGSGKTAVAGAAIARAVGAGHQAALMAPTGILADQHGAEIARLLAPLGVAPFDPDAPAADGPCVARLVGALTARQKRAVAAAVSDGRVAVVVGTHALIERYVRFRSLGLVVIDEQHRFGVLQRAELAAATHGATEPHVLYMTATPIPRTLGLMLHADLDQSRLDELPPGRTPVKTAWLGPDERARAYAFVRGKVAAGEQAFVVFPLVEESASIDARAASAEHERLASGLLAGLRVGLLHGRMRPAEKDAVMAAFRAGDLDVLVATTVIEVGVDVPNASVMVIEGAERFGLAQLHQLRGRVGRGAAESACLLVAEAGSRTAARRLQALTRMNDGFALAELDLELRGPGDFFGVQQAGQTDALRLARGAALDTVARAARVAEGILAADPMLEAKAHDGLRAGVGALEEGVERA